MTGFLDALRLHGPGSALEAALLVACLTLAWTAYSGTAGKAAGGLVTAGSAAAFLQVGHISIPFAVAGVGVLLWRRPDRRPFERGGWAFAREMLLVMGGFSLYEIGRFSVVAEHGAATANAERVVSFERALGSFFEPRLQEWAIAAEVVNRAFSTFYSHGFLAVVVGAVLWLYFTDPPRYRLYRNALGISTALAIGLIAVFPVAPPRLMPGLGIEDTVVRLGAEHAFANEYAAIPSLHVGWFALTGWVFAKPLRGVPRYVVAVGPALAMEMTVIATGNHYWVDGVVGSALAVLPAVILSAPGLGARLRTLRQDLAFAFSGAGPAHTRLRVSVLSLGGLFLYLGLAQSVNPGFTDFWGYLFVQVGATLLALVLGEVAFARSGGLSPVTHGIAIVVSFADVFGTDGNLYSKIDEYDKLTHFLGTAAIAAGAYDFLRARSVERTLARSTADRLYLSMAIAIAAGVTWEVYEYLGDVVFHTTRTQGRWDTLNDVISDALGAFTIGWMLWIQERGTEPARETVRD